MKVADIRRMGLDTKSLYIKMTNDQELEDDFIEIYGYDFQYQYIEEIMNGIARAVFVSVYADQAEEIGHPNCAGHGQDWMDVVTDETDPECIEYAWDLLWQIEREEKEFILNLYKKHKEEAKYDVESLDLNTYGHYIGMEALGHGVGLFDFGIKANIPYNSFHYMNLSKDYLGEED